MKGFISAVRTLTIIPLPGKEDEDLSKAIPWFSLVGVILGLIIYAAGRLWLFLPISPWHAGGALLILILQTWLTRGLHLDGLADWADSIGGFERERRLAIMKDVSLGAFGVLALILALMAKWLLFERLLASGSFVWIIAIIAVSRGMLVELQVTLPYARKHGEGMAGAFINGASKRHRLISFILTFAICIAFGPVGIGLFFSAWLITRLYAARIRSQFGGITGDLLGTANEILEISQLALCALPGHAMVCYTGWGWVL
ncbi:Cobalamin synthase [uncultured Desulfobacterium sp.]|uniref:Adenosylcobinamide-GDP ribazoletransferase n=1 Tax=uncultured Desulfobacterium sp. TaxID=201089 RepID=A0A445N2F2_9BACT|nr:Cobalamin synthase [uncultured Desulfobacterium sp.]